MDTMPKLGYTRHFRYVARRRRSFQRLTHLQSWQQIAHMQKPDVELKMEFHARQLILDMAFSKGEVNGVSLLRELGKKWRDLIFNPDHTDLFLGRLTADVKAIEGDN